MKKPKFEFYTRLNGHTEFLEFLQTIPIKELLFLTNTKHCIIIFLLTKNKEKANYTN